MTKNEIKDDIINLLTKFGFTDDQRYDPDWLLFKIDEVRAYLIRQEYKQLGFTNPSWFQDLNLLRFTPVVYSDIDYGVCGDCPISKAVIPDNIPLYNPDNQNEDNGIKVLSACGTKQFYYLPLEVLRQIPSEHPRSKFNYYFKIGNQIFVNQKVNWLRINAVFQNPDAINTINNLVVPSGSLVVGTSYTVIGYQVVHNGLGYMPGQTFTAVNTVYTGSGAVELTTPVQAFNNATSNYPVTNDMARLITIEILTREFGVEKQQIAAIKGDFGDDGTQVTNKAAQV